MGEQIPEQYRSFHLLVFNTHLLPNIAAGIAGKRSVSNYRARAIGQHLNGFELIGLTEVFDIGYKRKLIESFAAEDDNTSFQLFDGPKRSGRHLINGGLLLLSKFPIVESHEYAFQSSTRFITSGLKSDGFATKGILHARLNVDAESNLVVDVFLTHLESQSSSVRRDQIAELTNFIEDHCSPSIPVMLMGDLNVVATVPGEEPKADSEFMFLRNSLNHNGKPLIDVAGTVSQPNAGTSNALEQKGGDRIDYIFVSDEAPPLDCRLVPRSIQTLPFHDDRVPEGSLSDHKAIYSRLDIVRIR